MRLAKRLLAAGLGLVLLGAGPGLAGEVTDARGRTVRVEDTSRIVSIGGDVTEIVYALGRGEDIVAVDTTSTYPAGVGEQPNVGYMRALSAEGVLSREPSVVLAAEGSGPPEAIEVLETASVPFVAVPSEASPEGVAAKIRLVAQALDETERGNALAEAVEADIAAVREATSAIDDKRSAIFVMAMQGGSPLAAGADTSAVAILELAGARNALDGFAGYKPASSEAVLAAQPEAVVTMSDRDHALGERVLGSPAFANTPAGREGRAISMSGSYLLGFGPRTAHAARELASRLYPDRPLPELPARDWARGPHS